MNDHEKSKQQLLRENAALRQRVSALEASLAERKSTDGESGRALNEQLKSEVAEGKRIEKDLRESERRYRSLVEITSDVVWEVDRNNRLTYASPKATELWGYEPDELIGHTPFEFMPPEQSDSVAEFIGKVNEAKQPFSGLEHAVVRKDGSRMEVEASGVQILDAEGNRLGGRGISRDITERKKLEQTQRQSEEQYRQIVESVADGLLVITFEGRIIEANPAACQIYGYTHDELTALPARRLVHPDYHRRFDSVHSQLGTNCHYDVESVNVRKDGSAFCVEVHGSPFSFKGKPHLLAVIRDITERKKAEKAKQKEERNLRRSLEASDRERKLIAYDIHDGVAQHLAAAIMQFQTYSQLPSHEPGEASKPFDAGLQLLSKSLTEARRLISGVRPPLLDEMGVLAAIEHLIYECSSREGRRIDFQGPSKWSRLDPALENALYRIVQESLANVFLHSKSKKAQVGVFREKDRIRVTVQDWGVGFAPDNVPEACFGLVGIRERARVFGGRAMIDSSPGEGTFITVEVPLMEDVACGEI